MKKEIITICGEPGSGKSSTAKLIAKELDYEHFSSGDFMRKMALERGISLEELSTLAENDTSIDLEIDKELRKMGENEKIVIDSRLAFHWMPESFKVYLDLAPEIAKNRILNDLQINTLRQQSEKSSTAEEIYKKITTRLESEKKRYLEMYNLDYTKKNNFDLVIDTNKNNLEQVVKIIISEYKKWIAN